MSDARERLQDMVRTERGDMNVHSQTEVRTALDAYRAEVFEEAIAALQGMHDLVPDGLRASHLAFSVGVLMGARDFPGEVPGPEGGVAVNKFTDRVYSDAYATGRTHAGAAGWVLAAFVPVFSRSDGSDREVTELRHRDCGQLVQGVGPHTLIDLMALAARHECGGRS